MCILIKTDSHFLYDSITLGWMDDWRDLGWTRKNGQPLRNEMDFRALDRALDKNDDMNIRWDPVYAYGGEDGNEEAVRLAKLGAQKYYF